MITKLRYFTKGPDLRHRFTLRRSRKPEQAATVFTDVYERRERNFGYSTGENSNFGMTNLLDNTDGCHDPDESVRPMSVPPIVCRRRPILTDRWIDYPEATKILQRMEELRVQRAEPNKRNLLIIAPGNNGRSALANRFAELHPPRHDAAGGVHIPVLVLPASPVLNRIRFIYGIFELLFTPYIKRGPHQLEFLDTLEIRANRLLRYVNLEMLIIDDLHHALAGSENDRKRLFHAMFRMILPDSTVVVATTTEEHAQALQRYPEIRDGFEVVHLPKWKMGPDYLRFLEDLGAAAPPAKLSDKRVTKRTARSILRASGGTITGIVSAAAHLDYGGWSVEESSMVAADSAATCSVEGSG